MSSLEKKAIVHSIVRRVHGYQKSRILISDDIIDNFKKKLNIQTKPTSKYEIDLENKRILGTVRKSYHHIVERLGDVNWVDLDSLSFLKIFKGDKHIGTYAELRQVYEYMQLIKQEEVQMLLLDNELKNIEVYTDYLCNVEGLSLAMAGVLISEINITKHNYPSSIWTYAGLSTSTTGKYVDDTGKEFTLPAWKINEHYDDGDIKKPMLIDGKYPVRFACTVKSRREYHSIREELGGRDDNKVYSDHITFNPFLKIKLINVLGTSFLRSTTVTVNGETMGILKRTDIAKANGLIIEGIHKVDMDETVINYLRDKGFVVEVKPSEFGKVYYEYKKQMQLTLKHSGKSGSHIHNMAIRYTIKRFLCELYIKWRTVEGLPVSNKYLKNA